MLSGNHFSPIWGCSTILTPGPYINLAYKLIFFVMFPFPISGDVITFDNRRVLHARSSFVLTTSEYRHFEGAYLDWDDVQARMRVIRDEMFNQEPL